MDKSAIEKLEHLIMEGMKTDTDIKALLLPNGVSVHSLERHQNQPARYRAHFKTTLLGEFTEYLKQNTTGDSDVFIDPSCLKAHAVLDLGNPTAPQWGDHNASLVLNRTPAYQALTESENKPFSQADMIDFLEDWAECVTVFLEDGTGIAPGKAIQLIRRIDIKATKEVGHEERDFGATRSAMEEVEAKSGAGRLPAYFVMTCEPYEGLRPRNSHCKFRLKTGGDKPALVYRIVKREQLTESIAKEFRLAIQEAGIGCPIHIGAMTYQ